MKNVIETKQNKTLVKSQRRIYCPVPCPSKADVAIGLGLGLGLGGYTRLRYYLAKFSPDSFISHTK